MAKKKTVSLKHERKGSLIVGVIFVLLGVMYLIPGEWWKLWPFIFIIVGGILVWNYYNK